MTLNLNHLFIKSAALLSAAALLFSCATPRLTPSAPRMESTIQMLCDPALAGREANTPSESLAAYAIARQLEQMGFEPLFPEGPITPLETHVMGRPFTTHNVVMIYRVPNATDAILLGAHYDHLGYGGPHSGSLRPDTTAIHPGADDNASGVALVLETARQLRRYARQHPSGPLALRHHILVAAFGAEEKGLIGSKNLADTLAAHHTLPTFMVNIDMVGRLKDSTLTLNGTGTFQEADSILSLVNPKHPNLRIVPVPGGYGPSDHTSFYRQNVPVLFLTTGPHPDYHTPFDTPDKINYNGLTQIASYLFTLYRTLDTSPLTHQTQEEPTQTHATFKISLGLIPDFTYNGPGFCAGTILPGRPSQKAGMQNGDIITQINDTPIPNIEAYMACLNTLTKGQTITITLTRNGASLTLTVQL